MELDYIPYFTGIGLSRFGPQTPMEGLGVFSLTIVVAPQWGFGGNELKRIFFGKKCLVKYCNFVFNLDHSLCHKYDGRRYVNLRFFYFQRKPFVIYEGIVLHLCISLREETMRE